MSSLFNSGHPWHHFVSNSMNAREQRLKTNKANSDRVARDLGRDRKHLERKEIQLMNEIRALVKKGDNRVARRVAGQVSTLRRIQERNFDAGISIQTKAQQMLSNHRINRAEMEAIKGIQYANKLETFEGVSERVSKYNQRMETTNYMEEMMNECFDDIYGEDEPEEGIAVDAAAEIDSIMRQAVDPNCKTEYFERMSDPTYSSFITLRRFVPKPNTNASITFSSVDSCDDIRQSLGCRSDTAESLASVIPPAADFPCFPSVPRTNVADEHGVAIPVTTMDVSFDMVKRLIAQDTYTVSQLGLRDGSVKPFLIGTVQMKGGRTDFVPFDFTKSLKSSGLKSGSEVWIITLDDARKLMNTASKVV